MQTRIANVIDSVGNQSSYDKCVKALLANKSILTWILKCCVDEFKSFDLHTISECIKGTPDMKTVHSFNHTDGCIKQQTVVQAQCKKNARNGNRIHQ